VLLPVQTVGVMGDGLTYEFVCALRAVTSVDGIIMTTPQVGAYNDIVKAAETAGIPVETTNSFDGTILHRNAISHTGQDASAA
ncbi:hypothetical protein ACC677_37785, partial [Rhizobium ruizarguesonis]